LTAPAGPQPRSRPSARSGAGPGIASRSGRTRRTVAPVLVRQIRNGIEESIHRGDVVESDASGELLRVLGDPGRIVTLRSSAKPFGVVALLEAGGRDAFDLQAAEIAIMAGSHSGEDLHVRTLQGLFRRAQVSQSVLACGAADMPLDKLTAARLARDGEKPGAIRHMCSGQHAVSILLSKLKGWPLDGYWQPEHPSQVAARASIARAFDVAPERIRTAVDGCGTPTYAFPLRAVARAYAFLAEPTAIAEDDPRRGVAKHLVTVRDAMVAHPELVAGTRDRLDTDLMKAMPGRVVSKSGAEALRGVAILAGSRASGAIAGATGLAVKIEDGGGFDRAGWAATVEALRQAGVLGSDAVKALAAYHRPITPDPFGRPAAEAIVEFELAPVGELIR
jgi:L-asparaginase II